MIIKNALFNRRSSTLERLHSYSLILLRNGNYSETSSVGYVLESSNISLDEAREMLLSSDIRGLQIRYRYQGSQWWDTLLPDPDSTNFRIVRIQHDFD